MNKLSYLIILVYVLHLVHDVYGKLPKALVQFTPAPGFSVSGEIIILATENGISLKGKITGLTPGLHGFHVHEKGDLGSGCKNAGGHFNPFKYEHGDPRDLKRHIGDLGNIEADENGVASVNINDYQATLNPKSTAYIGNLAMVVHSGADDLGRGGNAESLKTGNAGSRVSCGIIVIQEERIPQRREPYPSNATEGNEAVVDLVPGSVQGLAGHLKIISTENGVLIEGQVTGLASGLHGFHIHEFGDLGNGCKNAGGHFNPFGENHGGPEDSVRHVGDLGNIIADETGTAQIYILDSQPSLNPQSEKYIGNLSVVVHEGVDDLGRGGNPESLKTGNAGPRAGCGIINIKLQEQDQQVYQDQQDQQDQDAYQDQQHQQFDQDLQQQTMIEQVVPMYEETEIPIILPDKHSPSKFQNPHFATVKLVPGSITGVEGDLTIQTTENGVLIQGKITGLTPGLHGFHIHESGDLGNQCTNAGGHFNPFGQNHGAPEDAVRHVGDLGNIQADNTGTAYVHIADAQPSLDPYSETYVGNLSIVVHALADDLGQGGNEGSLTTGNAGARVACGLIVPHPVDEFVPGEQIYPAIVRIIPGSNSNLAGELSVTSIENGILIEGTVTGLSPGLHGFHIHEKNDLGNGCKDAGGHFNPFNANHGAPEDRERHVGDLGNIAADETGTARIKIFDSIASLSKSSQVSVLNRAVVIHALADDLGKGGNPESLKTGNAGARVGCGVIVIPKFTEDRRMINAAVKLKPGSSPTVGGELHITAVEDGVLLEGELNGLTPGLHGFHIHEKGDLGNECKNAGSHFNPFNLTHGDPNSEERHVGDLGNIEADENGKARIQIFDAKASFDPISLAYIGNRAVVVHASEDDLGKGGNPESLKTGNAGARVGCGVIVILQEEQTYETRDSVPHENESITAKEAVVDLVPGSDLYISGKLTVTEVPDGILIEGQINGINPGLHGFHIHEHGALGNECKDAGPHFNPFNMDHGEPNSDERHVGDLGNILADDTRTARIHIFDPKASLDPSSKAYIGNRSFVVHEKEDDLGNGGNPESLKTGNAGSRLGCGLIAIRNAKQQHQQQQQQSQQQQSQQYHQQEAPYTYRKRRSLYTDDTFSSHFSEPFDASATSYFGGQKSARVKLIPGTSKSVMGELHITDVHGGIVIKGMIYGLKPGLHGFHFHEKGDLGNKCQNAGGHFNPFLNTHGDKHDFERHVGDLGNIKADHKGIARIEIFDRKGTLDPHSQAFVGGISLVVHADPDDLGRGGNEESKKTGNSGARVGCGIVDLISTKKHHQGSFGNQQFSHSPMNDFKQHHGGHRPRSHFQNLGHERGHYQSQHHQPQHYHQQQPHQHQPHHHQQRHHGNPHQASSHQGSHDDVPVYTPKKTPRLNLSFNFGPPSRDGSSHGY